MLLFFLFPIEFLSYLLFQLPCFFLVLFNCFFMVMYFFVFLVFVSSSFYSSLEILMFSLAFTFSPFLFSFHRFWFSTLYFSAPLILRFFFEFLIIHFFVFLCVLSFSFSFTIFFSFSISFFLSYLLFLLCFACTLFSTFLIIIIYNVSKNLLQLSLYTTL